MSTPTGSPILRGLDQFNMVDTEHDAQRIFSVRPMEDIVGFPSIRVENETWPGVKGGPC